MTALLGWVWLTTKVGLGILAFMGLILGACVVLYILKEAVDLILHQERVAKQFGRAFGESLGEQIASGINAHNVGPLRLFGFETIREGSEFQDYVSMEDTSDMDDLIEALVMEGQDIIEHGG